MNATELIDAIRQQIDTNQVSADKFIELVTAVLFWSKCGKNAYMAAKHAIKDIFTEDEFLKIKRYYAPTVGQANEQ